jgi:large subunit ribosomal protein L10
MPTAQKERVVEQAKEWYDKSVGLVFTDYRGLKVKELQQLRRALGDKGGEIHVIKNTLFRLAAGEDAGKFPDELHNGPTAIAFVFQNESEVAKVLFDFEKQTKTLSVKGGYFGGKVFDAKGVEALSKLPPRDVLIAQVIGTIAAPLSNLVGVVEALYADPIRTIGAVADKVAEGSPVPPAPAEEPKAEAASVEAAAETAEESAPEAPAEQTETPEETTSSAEEAPVPAEESAPAEAPAEPEEAPAEAEGESA